MPQEMNVLCCYSCKMYQVHIVKKARKWQCRLCNAKQSMRQIYFQGSGRDCRLHVQQLNFLKANETYFLASELPEQNDTSCNTSANNLQKSDNDKAIESNWMEYLDSSKEEDLSNAEDLACDYLYEVEDMIPSEKSPIDIDNDSCNLKNIIDFNSESEDVTDETKELYSASSNHNSVIECNLQDNNISNRNCSDAVNIFESYSELDESLDF